MSNERDFSFDFIKGILIYLVIYGHVILYQEGVEDPFHTIIYTFHMPLFIFVSGYFAGSTLNGPLSNCINKVSRRFIIPGVIWCVFAYLIIELPTEEPLHYKLLHTISDVWFLFCLGYLYIVGCCIFKTKYKWALSIGLVFVGYAFFPIDIVRFIECLQLIRQWPLFVMGFAFRELINKLPPPADMKYKVIIGSLFLISTSIYILCIVLNARNHEFRWLLSPDNYIVRALVYQTGAFVFFYVFKFLYSIIKSTSVANMVIVLGQNTFGIYVMNGLLISLMWRFLPEDLLSFLPNWALAILITVLLYVLTIFIKKRTTLSGYLLGGY